MHVDRRSRAAPNRISSGWQTVAPAQFSMAVLDEVLDQLGRKGPDPVSDDKEAIAGELVPAALEDSPALLHIEIAQGGAHDDGVETFGCLKFTHVTQDPV